MVADAARVAHAGGGQDDLGGLVGVQGFRFFGGLGEGQAGEGEQVAAALQHGDGLLVQIAVEVPGVDAGGLGG